MKLYPRVTSTIPFGWELHEQLPSMLIEIPEEQETIEYIKKLRENKFSLSELASVIYARHNRKITKRGVSLLLSRSY